MKLLVTTSHSLLAVDAVRGEWHPLHRGLGLYFGIADDGHRTYVAARGRMVSSDVPREEERGCILVLDRAMRVVEQFAAPFPMRDLHEIFLDGGTLWTTCSFDNQLAWCDLATREWQRWQPLGVPAEPPFDVNHLNSFAKVDGHLAVIAHNFGASELVLLDPARREVVSREPLGDQSHNIRVIDGRVVTCSSGEGRLLGRDGWSHAVGGFPRGLLVTDDAVYVGISEIAERDERDLTTGRILVLDRAWNLVREIALPGEGLVLDIQADPR